MAIHVADVEQRVESKPIGSGLSNKKAAGRTGPFYGCFRSDAHNGEMRWVVSWLTNESYGEAASEHHNCGCPLIGQQHAHHEIPSTERGRVVATLRQAGYTVE